jgi:hypothetical protein
VSELGNHEVVEEHGATVRNKRIGLVISIFALMLAITEIMSSQAQTEALQKNVEASDQWAFFQAKGIREAAYNIAAQEMETNAVGATDPSHKKLLSERVDMWAGNAKREAEERKGIAEHAKHAEHERDHAEKQNHRYELAKGAFQIGIVLASASIITGLGYLVRLAAGLGGVGALLLLAGLMA